MDDGGLIDRHLLLAGDQREDFQEVFLIGAINLDLEEDPPQGRAVEDFIGVEVGGKDHQRVKGHGELFAGLQLQDVAAFFQRHDPAVHQLLRRVGLAAKVVHDEDAAIGFHLQRRGIGAGGGVVFQIEHVERQFAAGDDRGTLAPDIALIETVGAAAQGVRVIGNLHRRRMHDGVIDGDDLPRIFHGARDIDAVAQRITDAVGDRGFAVAGRAIHQDGAARADGRAKIADQVFGKDQMAHAAHQLVARQLHVADRLAFDLGGIFLQRHRHGAVIFRLREGI